MVGDTVVRAGLVGLALLPGCYDELCTQYGGLNITYVYETDCMGEAATGRIALRLPATIDGLPNLSVLTEQAQAGGLNAEIRGGGWVASTGESCENPLDAGQPPDAVLEGLYLDVYTGPPGTDHAGQAPFQCGDIIPTVIRAPTTRTCTRSVCPPAGGACSEESCTLSLTF